MYVCMYVILCRLQFQDINMMLSSNELYLLHYVRQSHGRERSRSVHRTCDPTLGRRGQEVGGGQERQRFPLKND